MNIILTTGVLLIILSFVFQKSKKIPPYWGFLLVLLIMGFQSNVEGDYMAYMEEFYHLQRTGIVDSRTIEREPLFPYMMLLFSWCPWWLFLILITFFEVFVLVHFVEHYGTKEYKYAAAIIFFFTFNMMLMQMKALRQAFAIELLVLAFLLIDKENKKDKSRNLRHFPWVPLFLVVLAYFTHNTSLILLPFIVLFWWAKRRPKKLDRLGNSGIFPFIILGIYALIVYVKEIFLSDYLMQIALSSELISNNYSGYFDGSNLAESFVNKTVVTPPYLVGFNGVLVYFVARTYQNSNALIRVFCLMSILAAIGEVILFNLGSLPRIVMYFAIFNLVVYPHVASFIRNRYGRAFAHVFLLLILVVAARISLEWMLDTTAGDRFGTYKFIFMN